MKGYGVVGGLGTLFAVVVAAASGLGDGDLGSQRRATLVARGRPAGLACWHRPVTASSLRERCPSISFWSRRGHSAHCMSVLVATLDDHMKRVEQPGCVGHVCRRRPARGHSKIEGHNRYPCSPRHASPGIDPSSRTTSKRGARWSTELPSSQVASSARILPTARCLPKGSCISQRPGLH